MIYLIAYILYGFIGLTLVLKTYYDELSPDAMTLISEYGWFGGLCFVIIGIFLALIWPVALIACSIVREIYNFINR